MDTIYEKYSPFPLSKRKKYVPLNLTIKNDLSIPIANFFDGADSFYIKKVDYNL